jgi:hypothetical protein
VVALILKITGLNENNKQFGKNVLVGHATPIDIYTETA